MPVEIRETPTAENVKSSWAHIMLALQPLVDHLPDKEDKDYFNGIMSFLIDKEPRMTNIDKNLMFLYIRKGRFIAKLYYYRNIFNMEYIRRKIIEYLNELALSLGEDGLLIKYGVGGYSRQYLEQKVINEPKTTKRTGFW